MEISQAKAIVSGGASGLGNAVAKRINNARKIHTQRLHLGSKQTRHRTHEEWVRSQRGSVCSGDSCCMNLHPDFTRCWLGERYVANRQQIGRTVPIHQNGLHGGRFIPQAMLSSLSASSPTAFPVLRHSLMLSPHAWEGCSRWQASICSADPINVSYEPF